MMGDYVAVIMAKVFIVAVFFLGVVGFIEDFVL
jgi:hypothetical protein